MPLKGITLRVTLLGAPMWYEGQLNPRYFENLVTICFKPGFVAYQLNLCHMSHFLVRVMCVVSQLKGRSYVSFYELILSCSIFEEIESYVVSLFF